MKWAIVVAETVIGKSRGPKGFKRFKPVSYSDSWKSHPIVYARVFEKTEKEALELAEKIDDEMLMIYTIGMGKTDTYCVRDYSIVLHNLDLDEATNLSTTIESDGLDASGYLYDWCVCTNKLLKSWGII